MPRCLLWALRVLAVGAAVLGALSSRWVHARFGPIGSGFWLVAVLPGVLLVAVLTVDRALRLGIGRARAAVRMAP